MYGSSGPTEQFLGCCEGNVPDFPALGVSNAGGLLGRLPGEKTGVIGLVVLEKKRYLPGFIAQSGFWRLIKKTNLCPKLQCQAL
jgi:hypothetical protein